MVENDTFTYHVKQSFIAPKSSDLQALISPERTRTLELLNHLLANSSKTLVICGSEGIGKSTLLNVLQEQKTASWCYCLVPVHAGLNFEKLQAAIAVAIGQDQSAKQGLTLSGAFLQLESQRKKLILMIDDAGRLAPGVIDKVIDYAKDNPVLRVIFALSHDDLTEKNSSDKALDASHLIEIPPLSEQQCGEFLRYLAAKSRSQLAFNEINDAMIAAVYRETQGIPGRIIAGFPGFDGAKPSRAALWILVAAVAGLVVIALCTQWYSASKYNLEPMPPSATQEQQPADAGTAAP